MPRSGISRLPEDRLCPLPLGSLDAPPESSAPGRLIVEEGLAWLVFDQPDKKVNVLSSRALSWFGEQIGRLDRKSVV